MMRGFLPNHFPIPLQGRIWNQNQRCDVEFMASPAGHVKPKWSASGAFSVSGGAYIVGKKVCAELQRAVTTVQSGSVQRRGTVSGIVGEEASVLAHIFINNTCCTE